MLDDFRKFVADEQLSRMGPIVQVLPKSSFDRSALSQFGIGVSAWRCTPPA